MKRWAWRPEFLLRCRSLLRSYSISAGKPPVLSPCGEGASPGARGKSQVTPLPLVGEEGARLQVQPSSYEPSQWSCADLHRPDTQLTASAPSRDPKQQEELYVCRCWNCFLISSRGEHPARSALSLALDSACSGCLYCPLSSPLEVTFPPGISRSSQEAGQLAHRHVSEPCSKVIPYQTLLLPAIPLFPPWLNHLKIEIVCSHPCYSCFICGGRKGNLGFYCNAIHKSLLESITLISSYPATN